MTNLFGLKKETIEKIKSVLERYGQLQDWIRYRPDSGWGEELTHQVLYRILDEIDDLLLPYTFDVSLFHHISDPGVIDHIQRAGKIFYENASEKTYHA